MIRTDWNYGDDLHWVEDPLPTPSHPIGPKRRRQIPKKDTVGIVVPARPVHSTRLGEALRAIKNR